LARRLFSVRSAAWRLAFVVLGSYLYVQKLHVRRHAERKRSEFEFLFSRYLPQRPSPASNTSQKPKACSDSRSCGNSATRASISWPSSNGNIAACAERTSDAKFAKRWLVTAEVAGASWTLASLARDPSILILLIIGSFGQNVYPQSHKPGVWMVLSMFEPFIGEKLRPLSIEGQAWSGDVIGEHRCSVFCSAGLNVSFACSKHASGQAHYDRQTKLRRWRVEATRIPV
jgi:hypothetical protein